MDGLSDLHRLDVEANFRLLNMGEKAADDEERALLESYYFGNGRRTDLIANFWFGDAPGAPVKPTILPGADWVEELKAADDRRRNYRDGTRMRNFEEGETSGTMKKIFARLPPWVAVETGQHLTREDLSKSVMKVAREFEMETGLRVLAAVVHR